MNVECGKETFSGLRERELGQGFVHIVGTKARRGNGSIQGQEEVRWAQDRALRGEQRRVQKEEEKGDSER